jgi:hypothetical protein
MSDAMAITNLMCLRRRQFRLLMSAGSVPVALAVLEIVACMLRGIRPEPFRDTADQGLLIVARQGGDLGCDRVFAHARKSTVNFCQGAGPLP